MQYESAARVHSQHVFHSRIGRIPHLVTNPPHDPVPAPVLDPIISAVLDLPPIFGLDLNLDQALDLAPDSLSIATR